MAGEYSIALYAAAAIAFVDGVVEFMGIKWRWKFSRPLMRMIIAVVASVVAILLSKYYGFVKL